MADQMDLVKPGPAVVQEPLSLVAIRPQVGFPMKTTHWNRLKRSLRRLQQGQTNLWKDFGLVFLGGSVGLLPQLWTDLHPTSGHLEFTFPIVLEFVSVTALVICFLAARSTRTTESASITSVLEEMDDIEADYLDMSKL